MLIPLTMMGIFVFRYVHFSQTTAKGDMFPLVSCEPDPQGNINQTIDTTKGSTSSFDWAESNGCITRPILETWAVTTNPDEMGVSGLAKYTVKEIDPPPAGAVHLFQVDYTVQSIFTVSWTMNWLHQLVQGTLSDPQEVAITVTKVSGSSLISHISGLLHLTKISPNVTMASVRFELKTPETNADTAAQASEQVITRLRSGNAFWQGVISTSVVDYQ
jgi:hypothetical protein